MYSILVIFFVAIATSLLFNMGSMDSMGGYSKYVVVVYLFFVLQVLALNVTVHPLCFLFFHSLFDLLFCSAKKQTLKHCKIKN